jgi:hypothetical protein
MSNLIAANWRKKVTKAWPTAVAGTIRRHQHINWRTAMANEFSGNTVAILKDLDHAALSACLFAACDLALRAARGQMPTPPETMTPDQLVRQLVTEMPDNFKQPANPS